MLNDKEKKIRNVIDIMWFIKYVISRVGFRIYQISQNNNFV